MSTKRSVELQYHINKLHTFATSLDDLIADLPEGIGSAGLRAARDRAVVLMDEAKTEKAEAVKVEEAARLKGAKNLTIRRVSYDPLDKVTVTLTPTSYSDWAWEVRLDGELMGTISKFGDSWEAKTAYGNRARSYITNRPDAIRALLPR